MSFRNKADVKGFTLIELLVVIAIIGLLMGLSSVAVRKLLAVGRKAACISNLKQLHTAAINFAQDGGRLPYAASEYYAWRDEDDGSAVSGEGQRTGWVDWYDRDNDQRTYWWGDKGLECIRKGTLLDYVGEEGDEGVFVCPEHVRLARGSRVVDCSGKNLSGLKGTEFRPTAVRSYGMNNTLSHAKLITFKGAARTMLFAEQAFESQHADGFQKGYGLRYVSIGRDAADEWIDPGIEDLDGAGSVRQRFYRSWDGSIDRNGPNDVADWIEPIGEMHSRTHKRLDGSVSQQGVAVFLDGHVETVDIRDTLRIATGDWGDD